jgi:hypothetical protein
VKKARGGKSHASISKSFLKFFFVIKKMDEITSLVPGMYRCLKLVGLCLQILLVETQLPTIDLTLTITGVYDVSSYQQLPRYSFLEQAIKLIQPEVRETLQVRESCLTEHRDQTGLLVELVPWQQANYSNRKQITLKHR